MRMEVALKQLVDGVAVQAVEACLIRGLENIMSPSSILEMDSDTVNRIASEPQEHQQQRDLLTRKLAVLNSGLETCKRYVSRSTISKPRLDFLNAQQTYDGQLTAREIPLSNQTNGGSVKHDAEDAASDTESIAKPVEERLEVAARKSSCFASELIIPIRLQKVGKMKQKTPIWMEEPSLTYFVF